MISLPNIPLTQASFPWFVVGGWAVDLFLDRQSREHADLDLGILRRDQLLLQQFLKGWKLTKTLAGSPLPWTTAEELLLPVHEIHAQQDTYGTVEILLSESEADSWVYRRDTRVRRDLSKAILTAPSGVRFLAPEVVLLFKSKSPRPHDERDFASVLPSLSSEQRIWLREALCLGNAQNKWLALL